jgi:hypothetical protein
MMWMLVTLNILPDGCSEDDNPDAYEVPRAECEFCQANTMCADELASHYGGPTLMARMEEELKPFTPTPTTGATT